MALRKQFNATKYQQFPWLKDIHRDAHAHLARPQGREIFRPCIRFNPRAPVQEHGFHVPAPRNF
ncbi:MAG: hypothetical protein LBI62_05780 [Candidatus Accumulibacter sp.]|jgi:hypothetical protein|nr:hypothetical protein [Accumulibacter sp.]